jgi:hypothetical protein
MDELLDQQLAEPERRDVPDPPTPLAPLAAGGIWLLTLALCAPVTLLGWFSKRPVVAAVAAGATLVLLGPLLTPLGRAASARVSDRP